MYIIQPQILIKPANFGTIFAQYMMLVALIPVCVWLQDNGVQDDDELGVYHCIISRTYHASDGYGYPRVPEKLVEHKQV